MSDSCFYICPPLEQYVCRFAPDCLIRWSFISLLTQPYFMPLPLKHHPAMLPSRKTRFPSASTCRLLLSFLLGQALDLLVTVSSMCYHTSTPALSTLSSSRGLTGLSPGISHLKGGFTLRCLQRLSLPDLATQLCHWYDNWFTSGPSSPVLSY